MAFGPERCLAEARLFAQSIVSSLLADRIAASPQMALRHRETTFGRHFRTSPDSSSRNMTRCSAHSIWHMPIKNLFNESFLCSFENSN